MKKIAIATVFALAATATAANAYDRGGNIDQRQYRQQQRIQQGVRSGQLTRWEAARLQAEQARIRRMEAAAKRDGHVDRYEAARIRAAQNAAGRHIAQEKHDGQRRYGGGWAKRRWW